MMNYKQIGGKSRLIQNGMSYAAVCATGVLLSLYSVLLKFSGIPCLTSGCHDVINSPYGTLFGIPVGLISLALWITLLYPAPRWSQVSKTCLVLGSAFFISVQAFVLHQFCLICCLHAVACFTILFLKSPQKIPTQWGYVAVVGAFLAVIGTDHWTRNQLSNSLLAGDGKLTGSGIQQNFKPGSPLHTDTVKTDSTPSLTSHPAGQKKFGTKWNPSLPKPATQGSITTNGKSMLTQDPTQGYPWLAANSLPETQLVVSLSCGHCLRLMERLLAEGTEDKAVANVLLLSNSKNRNLTQLFTAALLSRPDLLPHSAFKRAFGVVLKEKQALLANDARKIKIVLKTDFPNADRYLTGANRILLKQKVYLKNVGIPGTPYLIKDKLPIPLKEEGQLSQRFELNFSQQSEQHERTYAKIER